MLHTRRTSGPARFWPPLVRLLLLPLFLLTAALGTSPRALADPLPTDTVEAYREALVKDRAALVDTSKQFDITNTDSSTSGKEAHAKYAKELDQKYAERAKRLQALEPRLTSLGQVIQVLTLEDAWVPTPLTYPGSANDSTIIDRLAEKIKPDGEFAKAVKSGNDVSKKVATATLLSEGAVQAKFGPAKERLLALTPLLVDLLHSEKSPVLRQAVAVALGRIAPQAFGSPYLGEVVAALKDLLKKAEAPGVRLAAADALDKPWITILEAGRSSTAIPVPAKLLDGSADALPVIIAGLTDDALELRLACAKIIKDMFGVVSATDRLPNNAAKVFQAFRDNMPTLRRALEDKDPEVRLQVLNILEELAKARRSDEKPSATEPIPTRPISDEGRPTELPIALTLPAGEAPPGVPADDIVSGIFEPSLRQIARAVRDPDVRVRRSALYILESLGDSAAPVIPELVTALSDRDRFARWTALRALGRLAPRDAKRVIPAVIPQLQDTDPDLRIAAANTVERYGPAAAAAVPRLRELLGRGDPQVRIAYLSALVGIGTDAAPALPAVATLLQNPDTKVRVAAADTLARFGPLASRELPALERALDDPEEDVRRAVSGAFLRVKGGK